MAKAVTWRALGSVDTFALSYLFTGNAKTASSIALTEVFTKIALYTAHDLEGIAAVDTLPGFQPYQRGVRELLAGLKKFAPAPKPQPARPVAARARSRPATPTSAPCTRPACWAWRWPTPISSPCLASAYLASFT